MIRYRLDVNYAETLETPVNNPYDLNSLRRVMED